MTRRETHTASGAFAPDQVASPRTLILSTAGPLQRSVCSPSEIASSTPTPADIPFVPREPSSATTPHREDHARFELSARQETISGSVGRLPGDSVSLQPTGPCLRECVRAPEAPSKGNEARVPNAPTVCAPPPVRRRNCRSPIYQHVRWLRETQLPFAANFFETTDWIVLPPGQRIKHASQDRMTGDCERPATRLTALFPIAEHQQ